MFSIPKTELPENKRVQLTAEELRALRAQTKLEKSNPDLVKKVEEKREEINNDEEEENEVKEALIGFARLYSGSLVKGDKVFILGPKYSPKTPTLYVTEFEITTLYQLMGRDLHPLDTVTAGFPLFIQFIVLMV